MKISLKIAIGFLIIVFCFGTSHAQTFAQDTAKVHQLLHDAQAAFPNQHEQLRKLTNEAYEISKKINYKNGIAQAYYLRGLFYKLKSDYDEEIKWITLALKAFEALNDQKALAKTYNEMGSIYNQQGDYKKALFYNEIALKIHRKNKNLQGQTISLMRIGNAYAEEKDYPKAIQTYEEALKIQEILKNDENVGNILNNLGVVHYEIKEYAKALAYHKRSFELLQKVKHEQRYSAAYYNMGRIYLVQNQTKQALDLGKKALKEALRLDNKQARREACSLLAEAFFQDGNYKEAYLFEKQFKEITDSIYNIESRSKIEQIQSIYDLESKEQKIKILNQEKKIAQFWFYGIAALAFLILIITLLIILNQRNKILKKQEIIAKNIALHDTEQALKQAELENQTLKTQALESHLDFKNKELTTFTLHFAQKNNMIQDIRQGIQEVTNQTDKDSKLRLNRLIKLIDHTLNTDSDWDDFKLYFEQVHKGFFENLKNDFAELSSSELRLCALMRLNLNSKEISNILGISPESVKMARHRLRKKLNLSSEDNLTDFVLQY